MIWFIFGCVGVLFYYLFQWKQIMRFSVLWNIKIAIIGILLGPITIIGVWIDIILTSRETFEDYIGKDGSLED